MMHALSDFLTFIAAASSLIAAAYWFRLSSVLGPTEISGPVYEDGHFIINLAPINRLMTEGGRLNRAATRWSGIAAACAGVAALTWQLAPLT